MNYNNLNELRFGTKNPWHVSKGAYILDSSVDDWYSYLATFGVGLSSCWHGVNSRDNREYRVLPGCHASQGWIVLNLRSYRSINFACLDTRYMFLNICYRDDRLG